MFRKSTFLAISVVIWTIKFYGYNAQSKDNTVAEVFVAAIINETKLIPEGCLFAEPNESLSMRELHRAEGESRLEVLLRQKCPVFKLLMENRAQGIKGGFRLREKKSKKFFNFPQGETHMQLTATGTLFDILKLNFNTSRTEPLSLKVTPPTDLSQIVSDSRHIKDLFFVRHGGLDNGSDCLISTNGYYSKELKTETTNDASDANQCYINFSARFFLINAACVHIGTVETNLQDIPNLYELKFDKSSQGTDPMAKKAMNTKGPGMGVDPNINNVVTISRRDKGEFYLKEITVESRKIKKLIIDCIPANGRRASIPFYPSKPYEFTKQILKENRIDDVKMKRINLRFVPLGGASRVFLRRLKVDACFDEN